MTKILINGEQLETVAAGDRGLHYGDGLFETLVCKSGSLQFWHEHLQRLNLGCARLGLSAPDERQWLQDIRALNIQGDAVVKLILTRGGGGRGYRFPKPVRQTRMVACYELPVRAGAEQGVRVRLCKTPVSSNVALAGIKHLNRLDNVLARNEWEDDGIAEGLMCDDAGHVIEGTMSNLFSVQNETLVTPVLNSAGIEGIVRNKIIELAGDHGIVVQQANMTVKQLLQMDEVFLTNSVIGIWPVVRIEQRPFNKGRMTAFFMRTLNMEQGAYAL